MNDQRSGTIRRHPHRSGSGVQALAVGVNGPTPCPDDAPEEPAFRALTAAEAAMVREKLAVVSPWRVVVVQGIGGLLCAVLAGAATQSPGVMWSALYGAATAVLPNALLARGVTKRVSGPQSALLNFAVWEALKILLAVGMMVLAPRVIPQLSWMGFLFALVVCMKLSWVVLLWRGNKQ